MHAEDYLKLIGDWVDPNPPPVIVEHDGYLVVRDDLIPVGTKARGADFIVGHDPSTKHVKEWVYGSSPATGYAQVSIPLVCNRYGKKAVFFMAARSMDNLTEYQKKGINLGGDYRWIPDGMLAVTQKRAKDYVADDPETRMLLPIGLDHPTVIASLIRVARGLNVSPDAVWSVGSSGTLSRSLQLAFPNAEVHVVHSGGYKMGPEQIGRAIYHPTKYKFHQTVRLEERPPYPSSLNYDAKVWQVMKDWYLSNPRPEKVLVWNVAG